jgi:hypothetical protein
MSLNKIFNKLFFKKHKLGDVVASKDDKSFRKLTSAVEQEPKPPTIEGLDPDNFDLRWLGLKHGTYTLTVTSIAPSLHMVESNHSEPVEYTVK